MKKLIYFPVTILIFLIALTNCEKDKNAINEDENQDTLSPFILTNAYVGQLHLYFSNVFPEFESSGSTDVDVDRDGKMEFSSGGLLYSGTSDNGQSKIKREGEIIMMPHGTHFLQGEEVYFTVIENSMLTEQMTVWYWSGTNWVQAVNESISETWDGGLVFSLNEAIIDGSVVEASTDMGTVRWTLTLTPVPN